MGSTLPAENAKIMYDFVFPLPFMPEFIYYFCVLFCFLHFQNFAQILSFLYASLAFQLHLDQLRVTQDKQAFSAADITQENNSFCWKYFC